MYFTVSFPSSTSKSASIRPIYIVIFSLSFAHYALFRWAQTYLVNSTVDCLTVILQPGFEYTKRPCAEGAICAGED